MQPFGSFDVEVRDGYVVSARDPQGAIWAAAREGSMSRLLSHGLVMAAVAVPMMLTAASAHPATIGGRAAARSAIIAIAATPETSDRLLVAEVVAAARAAAASPPPAVPASPPAAAPAAPPVPPRPHLERAPVVGGGGHFAFGWCTWYVSTRRFVPWAGNAINWYPDAAAMGFAEGSTPRAGAIMVTRESAWGHVAYVESVDADGLGWTVSEMNFRGFGVVSSRHLRSGQVPVVGFIY